MANSIVPTQTSIPGVELIYLKERDAAGIHVRGLARMLDCDPKTVQRAVEGVTIEDKVEAEIETGGGIQGVTFILESGVIKVLKEIRRSTRTKKETRDTAEDLYDRFAVAGFKLYAMLKVAPDELKAKVDKHIEDLEILKLKQEVLKLEKDLLDKRDWIVRTLPESAQQKILGYTEVKVVEIRDRVLHDEDVIRDGSTINKTDMCRQLGLLTKSGSPDYKRLNKFLQSADIPANAWKLVASVRENEELNLDQWQSVQQKWLGSDRNLYIGE